MLNEGEKFRAQIERMQPYRDVADIIIADGASTDGASTPEALKDKVSALLVIASSGLSIQYRTAFQYALEGGYAGIITVDGNGKDGVDAIPQFIEKLKEGVDFVQGSRFLPGGKHENTPLIRQFGIRFIFNPLMWLFSGFFYTDGMNGFKAFSARLLQDVRVAALRDIFTGYSLQYYLCYRAPRLGFKVVEIPVARVYPRGDVPTKIKGMGAYLKILHELALTLLGCYNPREGK